jgi:putative ABC transport system permease protein
MIADLWQDLRYGARMLMKQPGFALVAVITLALGIGANSAIFSLIDAVLLRPLPVTQPERLVALTTSDHHDSYPHGLSYLDYEDFSKHNEAFSGVVAYTPLPLSVTSGDRSERAWGVMVSGNYFSMLGVRAVVGRVLQPDDAQPAGGQATVVLSHGAWKRRFGADPQVVGRSVTLNGHTFKVVGVAPPEFKGLNPIVVPELWVPLSMHTQLIPGSENWLEAREAHVFRVWARLKPGASFEQAQTAVALQAKQLEQTYPATNRGVSVRLYPQWEARLEPGTGGVMASASGLLMAVAGSVLLIACANIANLLLARSAVRRREMAVRQAVGASRGRLIRQLLTESLLVALLGAVVAALFAFWAADLIGAIKPPSDIPFALDARLDSRALGFNALIALLAVAIFGLAPALNASKTDLATALKGEEILLARRRRRLNLSRLLVVAQVAISLALLLCAGLFLRTFRNAQKADFGLRSKDVLLASLDLDLNGYDASRGRELYRELITRIRSLPSVKSLSMVNNVPLDFSSSYENVVIEGRELSRENEKIGMISSVVGSDYFATIGTPLLRGRDFMPQDDESRPGVVIINETMARRFWPNEDAIGKGIRLDSRDNPPLEVIGVAKDGKYRNYFEAPQPCLFLPWSQRYRGGMTMVLHTSAEVPTVTAALRREVAALDPNLPLFGMKTMEEHIQGRAMMGPRLAATLLSAFGLIGSLLAAVGLYGLMAYAVTHRTREIGIRMALGARRRDVLKLVIGQGMWLVFVGLMIGLLASLAITRLMESLLFGVSPTDLATFVVGALSLAFVALLACWIPARRAAKVDPMIALRCE